MKERSQTLWVGLSFMAVGLTAGLLLSANTGLFAGQANVIEAVEEEEQAFDVDALDFVAVSEDDDAYIGDPDAPVTIVEFSDYQCPYCARFMAQTLPLLKENYIDEGLVKLVYRDFPLPTHPAANVAAQAAECVRAQGDNAAYFEMHDMIFEGMGEWAGSADPAAVFNAYAAEMGYDVEACVANGDMVEEVDEDYTAGRGYGVSGTPTFFINGKKLVGAYPYEVFEAIIESQL